MPWRENKRWMKGQTLEIVKEKEKEDMVKILVEGKVEIVPRSWCVRTTKSEKWREMNMSIYIKEQDMAVVLEKKPAVKEIRKA